MQCFYYADAAGLLIDQVQFLCCDSFKKARATAKKNRELWLEMRFLFRYILLDNWEFLYTTIAESPLSEVSIDTS